MRFAELRKALPELNGSVADLPDGEVLAFGLYHLPERDQATVRTRPNGCPITIDLPAGTALALLQARSRLRWLLDHAGYAVSCPACATKLRAFNGPHGPVHLELDGFPHHARCGGPPQTQLALEGGPAFNPSQDH